MAPSHLIPDATILAQRPLKQEEADGCHYGQVMYTTLEAHKVVRNVACNLAWTDPSASTQLQQDISLAMVAILVIGALMDLTMHEPAASVGAGEDPDPPQGPTASVGDAEPCTCGANTGRDAIIMKERR